MFVNRLAIRRPKVTLPLLIVAAAIIGASLAYRTSVGGQSADGCDEGRPWPFESISCRVYQDMGRRMQLALDVPSETVKVSAEQAAEAASRANPQGSQVLETKLVYAWSSEGSFERDRKLLWAVSVESSATQYVSGYPFTAKALATVRPGGDFHSLTAAEEREVQRIAAQLFFEWRAQFTEEYHVDFIDPWSGEWLGAVEGAGSY